MEKISVIIPTYNRKHLVQRAIESVQQQSYQVLEILVIDDGSTDDTEGVVRAIEDERIRYVKLPTNHGAAYARNAGVDQARGDIIAFEDSDDVWRLNKLERQMDYWKQHPEFSMIYSAYEMHLDQGKGGRVPGKGYGSREELEGDIFRFLLSRNTIGTPTMVMRKGSFLKCGGFNAAYRSIEDWEFAIRFSKNYKIGYVDEALVDAQLLAGGVTSNTSAYYEDRCRLIATYRKEMEAYNIFDEAVGEMFERAQKQGLLEVVKKLLLNYLVKENL